MMHGGGWWSYIAHDPSKGKAQVNRALLRRVMAYAGPYVGQVVWVLLTIVAISLIELLPPLLYRDLIDNVLPNRNYTRLNWLALLLVGVPIVSGLIGVAQRYFSAQVGEGIIYDLRQEMYAHLQRMSMRFFTVTKAGEIISRFTNDVVGAQNAVTGTIPNIVTNLITLVSTLAVMISMEWRLTLLSVVVVPLFLIPTRRVAVILREIRREAMEYNSSMSTAVNETLSINGAMLVKIFGRQRQEVGRFEGFNAKTRDIGIRRATVGRWFFLGLGISAALGTALIYWVGGLFVLEGAISIGTIVAFAAFLGRLYGPISALTNVQVEFAQSMVSFERVFAYLDLPVEIEDRPDAVELGAVAGRVAFEGVSFSYMEAEGGEADERVEAMPDFHRRWALMDLDFAIEPGELAALVGPSGAGKTSITYLLPRLYDPTAGRITLDGHDLREVSQESLARQIGMVTQETYLFHDTVLANLLYARPTATQAEVEAACHAANIHELIAGLPDGYDTMVGERGYRFSGGEKQRLSIARVILKNPRILILDEATAHLDSQSEALIQAALEPLMQGRTSLVIAHRLSTILAADKILVMEKGRLAEAGTHAELLAQGGLYAQLYETQFRRE
ncbi:MAG: ABC transporter ATP-binding protein [Caldilineaceae bacterium]|nr:ABC transporter ATP-binding protein [Caldilineaceae bacterium]MBP8109978.1 ABC transporter ATP-binding protein [Caldilineaceae bacterium]MBP8125766.1 ABC transporter ATP-binding protein [Caldilineaceae bacterium]MBP9072426.1 ABC transporter ATP-binding protein [Caldilineaceae bacterium]